MADRSAIFPADEFRGRIARIQDQMHTRGVDGLLLTTAADIFYTTGFLTRFWDSPARPWYVVVPASGDPVAVIPSIGGELMAETWIGDIRSWDAPDPRDDGISLLAETVAGLVPGNGRIGVPMGPETHLRAPLSDYETLRARLSPMAFVDATACIQRVREIKSEAEILKIREACRIAGRAFDRVTDFASCGRGFDAVMRDFQMALIGEGADWVSYVAGGIGPDGYGSVISPPGPVPLRRGDVFMLDAGAVRDGYYCDFDRNYAVGSVSSVIGRAHAGLWQATEDMLTLLRPGMLAREVHALFGEAMRKAGVVPSGWRLGHGLGIALTEWPSFSAVDETPLRAGMVLTLEPGCVTEADRILLHEEVIVLRAEGAELLSPRTPVTLPQVAA